ncbi:unnamed protein product [Victoria cruziana]
MHRTDYREQPSVCGILLVEKQIVRRPKCSVYQDYRGPDKDGYQNVQSHVSQQEHEDRHDGQHGENQAIVHRPAEEHERLVAEEVQQEPGDENDDEDDKRDRLPEEAKEEEHEDDHGVVDAEVGEVPLHPHERLAEAQRARKGRTICKLAPGFPSSDGRSPPLLGPGNEVRGRRRFGR